MHILKPSVATTSGNITIICLLTCLFNTSTILKAQTISSEHGNLTFCDTMTRDVFIVWWDKDFDYSAEADILLDSMLSYRNICLNALNMQDPLSIQDGYYCNIYIHTPGDMTDYFTANYPYFGNGVGGDINNYPYMTLPNFVLDPYYAGFTYGRWINLAHETFHIFQTRGMWDLTPGIYLTDDGDWFVEASANWFAYDLYPDYIRSFVESEILVRIPHVPLWLGWSNLPGYYPDNWQRQVHQYALSTFLYYLTNTFGITDSALVSVFYSGTNLTPQAYLYNQLGGEVFRNQFIDCAAHMTNHFDFISSEQAEGAQHEWDTYADPSDDNQFIQTYINTGSDGWFRPDDDVTTNAWSFNTYKLENNVSQSYTFEIRGDETGTYGDAAYFQGKVLVQNALTGASFHDLVMTSSLEGALTLNLTPNDTSIYFIIAAMPEIFIDDNPLFQLFPYEMRISAGAVDISDLDCENCSTYEIARYNVLGQEVDKHAGGLQFVLYNNGHIEKVFIVQ